MRQRKCKHCKSLFTPISSLHVACSLPCAVAIGKAKEAKESAKADRAKREKLKTRSQWLKEAQVAFNAYIRARDKDHPCISCGKRDASSWDAGHYRTVKAAPQLRFNEDNCHKQCVPCNQHKSGNLIEYRIGLAMRIGSAQVEALETNNEILRLTIEDAKRIKQTYKDKLKSLLG